MAMTPVDSDPFGVPPATGAPPIAPIAKLTPVDHDPFGTPAGMMTPLERFGTGLRDPIEGGAQLLSHAVPDSVVEAINHLNNWLSDKGLPLAKIPEGGVDQMVRDREAAIKATSPPGTDWYRVAGNVANPTNYTEVGVGGRLAQGAILGARSAALQPETSGNFLSGKGKQIAEGAAAGTALPLAAQAVAPTLRPAAQMLSDLGIRLTPGQMGGGAAKRAEDALSSVPLAGSMVSAAQRHSIEDFNRSTLNQALAPIGATIAPDVPAGHAAIGAAQDAVSGYYNRLLGQVTFRVDQQFATDLGSLRSLVNEMPSAQREQFNNIINNRLGTRLAPTGTMDGQTFKQVESELGAMSGPMRASQDAAQQQLGRALEEVRHQMRDTLARANPAQAEALGNANRAYAMLSRAEDASMVRSTGDGVFTPADLLRSIRTNAKRIGNKKSFARGDAQLQDFANAGQDVLPQKLPNSGTTDRALWAGLVGGSYFEQPWLPLGLGAMSVPYTRPGLAAAREYVNPSVTRQQIGAAAEQAAPALAPFANQAAAQMLGADNK